MLTSRHQRDLLYLLLFIFKDDDDQCIIIVNYFLLSVLTDRKQFTNTELKASKANAGTEELDRG